MTFILNVLHRDFSLLASDTKGSSKGPLTINALGWKISMPQGGTIHGVRKIHLSRSKKLALGVSGNTGDHSYTDEIKKLKNYRSVLQKIHGHIGNYLTEDCSVVLEGGRFMTNAVITTYMEPKTKVFFSSYSEFHRVQGYTKLYAGEEHGCLIHAGSGSSVLDEAVGIDCINEFCGSIRGASDIPACVRWMREAYEKVSQIDEGSNEKMVAVVASKVDSHFRAVK